MGSIIDVGIVSNYRSGLAEGLGRDKREIDDFQKWLDKNPLMLRVKLDLEGAKAQAGDLRSAILSGLGEVRVPGILGPDGRPLSQSVAKEMNRATGLIKESTDKIYGKDGKLAGEFLSQVEQIGDGWQRISRFKKDAETGEFKLVKESQSDVRNLQEVERSLREIDKLGRAAKGAKARGDDPTRKAALLEQIRQTEALLEEAKNKGFTGTRPFRQAEGKLERYKDQLEVMAGQDLSKEERATRAARGRALGQEIAVEERRVQEQDKLLKGRLSDAKLIEDVVAREEEINRLMQERAKLFRDSRDHFRRMDQNLHEEGRPDLADRAFRRTEVMHNTANQIDLDERRRQNGLALDDRAAIAKAQAKIEQDAERVKARAFREIEADKTKAAREGMLNRIAQLQNETKQALAESKAQENALHSQTKKAAERRAVRANGANERAFISGRAVVGFDEVRRQAEAGGFGDIARQAGRAGSSERRRMVETADAHARAVTRGGHALDFHSGSLLRNAATFTRWYAASQLVQQSLAAIGAGISGAMEVDKQFATLRAVFRGTEEDASRLKHEVLALSAANGRAASEGMDAAIRFSRLGLTRVQIIRAVETSLVAANVAEISSAEAAEKLSAIMATYRLTVEDLPGVLNRLNAISNRYNVTNKDMLEGIVRVAGVAKQAGLALNDLDAVVGATTAATGKSGAEVGNALKFVISKISDPNTVEKLRDQFDIDLTKPNGDLMEFSDILARLSEEFPKLNTSQKSAFLNLTAGSRQAARFALVLEQYRQAMVLSAEADLDANSAWRENLKIVDSMASRIQALETAWTSLWTALGDTGALDLVTGKLSEAGLALQSLSDMMNSFQGQSNKGETGLSFFQKVTIGNMLAGFNATVADMNPPEGMMDRLKSKFGSHVNRAKAMMGSGYFQDYSVDDLKLARAIATSKGATGMAASIDQKLVAANVEGIRGIGQEVEDAGKRVRGFGTAAKVFATLERDIRGGSTASESLVKDFEAAAHLLVGLENGQTRYSQAVAEFNELMRAGDKEGAAALSAKLAKEFDGERFAAGQKFAEKQKAALAELTTKLEAFKKERDELVKTPVSGSAQAESRDNRLKGMADQIKEVEDRLKSLQGTADDTDLSALAGGGAKLSKWMDDLKETAKAFGDAFKDFGPDAENDPVDRIAQRHARAAGLQLEWLEEVQRRSEAVRDKLRNQVLVDPNKDATSGNRRGLTPELAAVYGEGATGQAGIDRELRKHDEVIEAIRVRISEEEKVTREKLRQADVEEQILRTKRNANEGGRSAANQSQAALVGRTESERMIAQAQFAQEAARRERRSLSADFLFGDRTDTKGAGDDQAERAKRAGRILQFEATERSNLLRLEERQYAIQAERKNLELQLVEAQKKQTEEVSKRLLLASREDQFRAAALARTLRGSGRLGGNEFMFLSQNSRQAMTNYLPQHSPAILDDTQRDFQRKRAELEVEARHVNEMVPVLRAGLAEIAKSITLAQRPGGVMDLTPKMDPRTGQDVAKSRDANPVVNLNVGDVSIKIDVAERLEGFLRAHVDQALGENIRRLEEVIRRGKVPVTSQGAVE
jgi:TP901 family phage tail tape measure protein